MDTIGFIVLLLVGVWFIFAAIVGGFVASGFSGRIEWPHLLACGGIGAACIYFAVTNAPFVISFAGSK